MPKLSLNDSPALKDLLGQEKFINNLCEVIVDCEPPKGIGINGYWGTGKTTTLINIYYQFSGKHPYGKTIDGTADYKNKKVIPIWFEAWRYQHEALPIVALLNEIRSQISTWNALKNKVEKVIGVSLLGALSAFDEVIKIASTGLFKPEFGKIKGIGEEWEKGRHLNQLPSQTIHQLLEEAIEQLAGKEHRLVIFVDDLDRCSPEKALQLMEGIKVYLNLSNCVIVFGMDQRQVEYALDQAQKNLLMPHQAKEYLEKICQDIYHLPVPDQVAKNKYFIDLLDDINLGNEEDERVGKHKLEVEKVLADYDCLPANPRKIKALINRLGVVLRHVDMEDSEKIEGKEAQRNYALLIMLIILHTFHRRVYEQLQKNPDYINTIIEYANADGISDQNSLPDKYEPMKEIKLSMLDNLAVLPTNPSDSNVFRLQPLFMDLNTVTTNEIKHVMKGGV